MPNLRKSEAFVRKFCLTCEKYRDVNPIRRCKPQHSRLECPKKATFFGKKGIILPFAPAICAYSRQTLLFKGDLDHE